MANVSPVKSQIFMPLRSNAGWFSNEETRAELERRLKLYLLLYDRLWLQDGRYHASAGDSGGMEHFWPANFIKWDRSQITYYQPGGDFGITVGERPLLQAKSVATYEIDYFPIISNAELLKAECVQWMSKDLSQHSKEAATEEAAKDLENEEVKEALPENRFHRAQIVKGFYHDVLLAQSLQMPFGVDYRIAPVLNAKREAAKRRWSKEVPLIFFEHFVSLDFPDWSVLSWRDIYEIRESEAGQDFRRMIKQISETVKREIPNLKDQSELNELVNQLFVRELVEQINARRTGRGKAVLSLALNFVPGSPVFGAGQALHGFNKEAASWISLLNRPFPPSANGDKSASGD